MVEVNSSGMLFYSIEKINLKENDILLLVVENVDYQTRMNLKSSMPDVLKNKVAVISDKIKMVHIANELPLVKEEKNENHSERN